MSHLTHCQASVGLSPEFVAGRTREQLKDSVDVVTRVSHGALEAVQGSGIRPLFLGFEFCLTAEEYEAFPHVNSAPVDVAIRDQVTAAMRAGEHEAVVIVTIYGACAGEC